MLIRSIFEVGKTPPSLKREILTFSYLALVFVMFTLYLYTVIFYESISLFSM